MSFLSYEKDIGQVSTESATFESVKPENQQSNGEVSVHGDNSGNEEVNSRPLSEHEQSEDDPLHKNDHYACDIEGVEYHSEQENSYSGNKYSDINDDSHNERDIESPTQYGNVDPHEEPLNNADHHDSETEGGKPQSYCHNLRPNIVPPDNNVKNERPAADSENENNDNYSNVETVEPMNDSDGVPALPDLVLEKIVNITIQKYPLMHFTLKKVCTFFERLVDTNG
jgi:hypothetical protein